MENMDLYSLASSPSFCHLMESEEDFPFGAKTTSFLPPATTTTTTTKTSINTAATPTTMTFDLPEWMEGRELLELPAMEHFKDSSPHPSTPFNDTLMKLEEDEDFMKLEEDEDDYCYTIKPEDMLVPLSELKPHTTPPPTPPLASTPPARPLHFPTSPVHVPVSPCIVPTTPPPAPAPITQPKAPAAPLPKIIICRKVDTSTLRDKAVKVHYQVMPVKQVPHITVDTSMLHPTPRVAPTAVPETHQFLGVSKGEPQGLGSDMAMPQGAVGGEAPQPCDAEELINEMVQMIGSSGTNASAIFQGLDNEMEASMEELLLQLEASNKALVTEPEAEASLSVPLPSTSPSSFSSLSLHPSEATSSCFLSPHPSETTVSASLSPHPSETTFSGCLSSPAHSESTFPASPLSLPSPVPSVGSLSPAQSSRDSPFPPGEVSSTEDCVDEEWSPLEEAHSYSKSTRKARPSRRTPASRKTPYPEDRKERKKEQNKQAALRYRQKKKQEEDVLTDKIEAEEERQQRLQTTYTGLKQELSYLKKIMREMFIAKGMLSEEALKKAALEKKQAAK